MLGELYKSESSIIKWYPEFPAHFISFSSKYCSYPDEDIEVKLHAFCTLTLDEGTKQAGVAVPLKACVQMVSSLSISLVTCYADKGFLWFSLFCSQILG
jgi:hypothetical protein